MAECPICGADITLAADAEEGEIMTCDDCGSELEVTGEDSVQEAFVELSRQRTLPRQPVAWLFRVVRNRAISAARLRRSAARQHGPPPGRGDCGHPPGRRRPPGRPPR